MSVHGTSKARVSMFESAYGQVPKDLELGAVLEAIRSDKWRPQIEAIRTIYAKVLAETNDQQKAKDAIAERKRELPSFCVSGTAESRTKPLEHSKLLQVDLDCLNGALEAVR